MARKHASQGTPATAALAAAGVPFALHPYSHDPAAASYGLEAAEVLGVDPARVFKTLMVDVDGRLAVGVVPVSGSLDLKAIAAALGGKKAAMADPAAAERRTGYVLGGISPLGQRQPSPTVMDDSALALDTILVSGGRRGLDIELAPADLIRLTGAVTAPIGTGRTSVETDHRRTLVAAAGAVRQVTLHAGLPTREPAGTGLPRIRLSGIGRGASCCRSQAVTRRSQRSGSTFHSLVCRACSNASKVTISGFFSARTADGPYGTYSSSTLWMISVGVRSSTARDTQSMAFRSTGAASPVSRRPSLWLIISCP